MTQHEFNRAVLDLLVRLLDRTEHNGRAHEEDYWEVYGKIDCLKGMLPAGQCGDDE